MFHIETKVRTSIDPKYITESCREAEHKMAIQAEKDTRPFVPRLTGKLVNSAVVRGNTITWSTPYVRTLYWNKKLVEPTPPHVVGFYNRKYGWFSRPGVKKVYAPKADPSLSGEWNFHSSGADHWFWKSANKNIGRWLLVAIKEISLHGNK